MIHAGKIATVICDNTCFRVVIDGETAAVVSRTTSEVHRCKASARPPGPAVEVIEAVGVDVVVGELGRCDRLGS